jgi:segregation and condensation protein A
MELKVHLDAFEGPLDLLLHLIDKNKINIYDIPIARITDQYMEYLSEMEKYNLEVASEFLVMASTLLNIKSKMLLPREEDENGEEIDPREELVQQLVEYRMVRTLSSELYDMHQNADNLYFRDPTIPKEVLEYEEPVDTQELMSDITLQKLGDIFESVLRRKEDRKDPIRARFGDIPKEEISLEQRMGDVREYVLKHRKCSFRAMLSEKSTKVDVIVTFLSILELMKTGVITVSQEKIFDDINITLREDKVSV